MNRYTTYLEVFWNKKKQYLKNERKQDKCLRSKLAI